MRSLGDCEVPINVTNYPTSLAPPSVHPLSVSTMCSICLVRSGETNKEHTSSVCVKGVSETITPSCYAPFNTCGIPSIATVSVHILTSEGVASIEIAPLRLGTGCHSIIVSPVGDIIVTTGGMSSTGARPAPTNNPIDSSAWSIDLRPCRR